MSKAKKLIKRDLWLQHFIDPTSPTFMNRTASAKAAGYRAKNENTFAVIGYQNFRKLHFQIQKLLAESLTEARVAAKIVQLMDAKETKFFVYQGKVIEKKEVEALGIQIKATQLAAHVLGMLRERHEVSIVGSVMDLIDGTSRGLPK